MIHIGPRAGKGPRWNNVDEVSGLLDSATARHWKRYWAEGPKHLPGTPASSAGQHRRSSLAARGGTAGDVGAGHPLPPHSLTTWSAGVVAHPPKVLRMRTGVGGAVPGGPRDRSFGLLAANRPAVRSKPRRAATSRPEPAAQPVPVPWVATAGGGDVHHVPSPPPARSHRRPSVGWSSHTY